MADPEPVVTLDNNGSAVVNDSEVRETSLVIVVYVHAGVGNTPLTIVSQGTGTFTVSGANNRDFAYFVFNNG